MSLPDVVYLVRNGDHNEELRFSLRSLANLPHRRVWLAGHRPKWVSEQAGHIPTVQGGRKWVNQHRNLRAACEHDDVSDTFVMFNDDFYVTHPIDTVPVLHRGLLSQHVAEGRDEHVRRLRETAAYLGPDALSYDKIHVPMTFDKRSMLAVLDEIGDEMLFRTVYGNRMQVGGVEHPNVKVRERWDELPPPFLSTSSGGFRKRPVGRQIRRLFPSACVYELW